MVSQTALVECLFEDLVDTFLLLDCFISSQLGLVWLRAGQMEQQKVSVPARMLWCVLHVSCQSLPATLQGSIMYNANINYNGGWILTSLLRLLPSKFGQPQVHDLIAAGPCLWSWHRHSFLQLHIPWAARKIIVTNLSRAAG